MTDHPTETSKRTRRRNRAVVIVLCLSSGAAGWGIWHEFHDQWFPRNLGPIAPNLVYRSGQIDRHLIHDFLESRSIRRIVVMSNYEFDDPDHVAQKEAADALNIEVIRHAMAGDGVGTAANYAAVVALIDESINQNIPTLVHCSAGSQRTGGTVAAYRLLVQHADPDTVFHEAAAHGWDPHDDHAWPDFLNQNMSAIAQHLVDVGVIDGLPDPLPRFPTN